MIKKIFIAILFCIAGGIQAQNGTVSPYSYFGIGELRAVETVESQMMGGLSMFADSIHVNLKNPAAYSKLALTTYTAGFSYRNINLKSDTNTQNSSVSSLEYLSLGFKLGKGFGLGFGIMPYSSVGYSILTEKNIDGTNVRSQVSGGGGINKVYLSVGYEIFKDVSVGVTANYNYGTLETEIFESRENVQFDAFDRKTARIGGADFNFALNYSPLLKNSHRMFASLAVNSQSNLVSENSQRRGSMTQTGIEIQGEDLELGLFKNTTFKIPPTTVFGLGYGKDRNWFIGAEYSFQQLSSFDSNFLGASNLSYKNASSIGIGGYIVPDYSSFSSYLKRVTYRAGAKYTKSGMVVNNEEINNLGITFGLGLPLGGNLSNLNIGFEVGKRGTTAASLVEENYFKISLGLSLNDSSWFRKTKIN
ncbi:MAG: hypothetical protein V3U92_08705 [Cellulophaga sp.]